MPMFCPACGQERASDATIYCSRCGFLLSGAADLLTTGGVLPIAVQTKGWKAPSPRNRGLKQGFFIFLLAFLIVPIISIFTIAANAEPFAVVIAAILLTVGGLLRMAYALMFQSTESVGSANPVPGGQHFASVPDRSGERRLPPQHTQPAQSYVSPAAGHWRDTNDLEPTSVTDNTTRLLNQTDGDQ
jgi:hypothetical protein